MLDILKADLKVWSGRLDALRQDTRGVTAVEYSVIAALIIGAVALAFSSLGTSIGSELGVAVASM
jgi:Flp pilus assembly pilin Flp